LLILFLFLYLQSIDFDKFKHAQFVWGYIGIATALGLTARYWQVLIWFVLLTGLGATNLTKHSTQLIYVYAKSWLGRYIPGTAPWILGKIYFASKHGIPKQKLAVSSLLEGGLQITVTMAVAAVMLLLDSRLDVISGQNKLLIGLILLGCIITMLPPVFNKLISWAYRLLRRQNLPREHLATNQTVGNGVLLYTIGALINGLSLFFIAKAVDPSLSYHNVWFVMAAGNLSAAASMLAIFAPSGLGVREGIQLVLLSVIMPTELALLVTVVTRLWSVLLDFIFFGLSRLLMQTFRR
jgi:uncharacterized membrane protein YbhN (UPF0104 family)